MCDHLESISQSLSERCVPRGMWFVKTRTTVKEPWRRHKPWRKYTISPLRGWCTFVHLCYNHVIPSGFSAGCNPEGTNHGAVQIQIMVQNAML